MEVKAFAEFLVPAIKTIAFMAVIFALAVLIVTAIRKRNLKFLPITVLAFIVYSFLPGLTLSELAKPYRKADPNEESYNFKKALDARENLRAIAEAQISYFVENNYWAGYDDDTKVFSRLGVKITGDGSYAYYCGNDNLIPAGGKAFKKYPTTADWPFGLHPQITVGDFICMAVGNNDDDPFPDVWMINKFKKPIQIYDDQHNEVLLDVNSKPFVENVFYKEHLAGKDGNKVSRVFVRVNLCAFRIDLYYDGLRLKSYPIAIGMTNFKTPARTFYLENMEWNPWWYPPNANWCKKEGEDTCKPVGPGPWNPLYPVKMILQSSYLMHGTPKISSIGKKASHGCMRMHPNNAADLAWKIMVLTGTVQPLAATREMYRDESKNTYRIVLAEPVQVNTVYERLEIYDGKLLIHSNPYKWQDVDAESIEAFLAANGLSMDNFTEDDRKMLSLTNVEETISVPLKLTTAANE